MGMKGADVKKAGSPHLKVVQDNPEKEFYTVSQLAKLLQLTEMTIYRMVNQGKLPCYCIGRIKRFRHDDVEEFLQTCRVPAGRGNRRE
jgi:excisionase family DNA binding protein